MRAVPHLCELYPGICLTTEEKAWKNLSQGSRRVSVGTIQFTVIFFSVALRPKAGHNLLILEGFYITHNDAPQSVGLLWTSDQLVAETST